jgi:hypothetical protein
MKSAVAVGVSGHTDRGLEVFCRTSTAGCAPATMSRCGYAFCTADGLEDGRDII